MAVSDWITVCAAVTGNPAGKAAISRKVHLSGQWPDEAPQELLPRPNCGHHRKGEGATAPLHVGVAAPICKSLSRKNSLRVPLPLLGYSLL